MPSEVRARVFEPFFTTKRRGTGLGLAIVKRLVELHGGTVSIENPPSGTGTSVSITLPVRAELSRPENESLACVGLRGLG